MSRSPRSPGRLERLLARLFPGSLRSEAGDELARFLATQRREPRYAGTTGRVRFVVEVAADALRVRLGRCSRHPGAMLGSEDDLAEGHSRLPGSLGPPQAPPGSFRTPAPTAATASRSRRSGAGQRGTGGIGMDMRVALRSWRRRPATAGAAILTLALGIGASAVVFSAVDGILLRPLPYPDPEAMVKIERVCCVTRNDRFAVPLYVEESEAIAAVGLYAPGGLNFGASGEAMRVSAAQVTAGFFEAMGVPPAVGRHLADDDEIGPAQLAVISDGLWRDAFGSDPRVLERSVSLNSVAYQVVGVMPAGFAFPAGARVWVPFGADRQLSGQAYAPDVIARLAEGVTPEWATGVLDTLQAEEARRRGVERRGSVSVVPLHEDLVGDVRPMLLTLLAAVGLVVLVACTNVSNLLLAHVAERRREFVVRAALGAGRGRMLRQLLVEAALLAGTACVAALLVGSWLTAGLRAALPASVPRADMVAVDGRVASVIAALTVGLTVVVGSAPGWYAAGTDLGAALRGAAASTTVGRRWNRVRRALIVAQIGMALPLLFGAALLLRTFAGLVSTDLGIGGRGVMTAKLTLPRARYAESDVFQRFYGDLERRLLGVEGVESVAATQDLPLSPGTGIGISLAPPGTPRESFSPRERPSARLRIVTDDYFRLLGIPLRAGRTFGPEDGEGDERLYVVSESYARALEAEIDAPAIGRSWWNYDGEPGRVIGIVGDVRHLGPERQPSREIYVPFSRNPRVADLYLLVRGRLASPSLAATLRAAVQDIDPELPVQDLLSFDELLAAHLAERRFATALMSAFGTMALALAAIGIYGVVSYSIQQRRAEIGVRLALGASPERLLAMMLREVATTTALGVVLGSAGAATFAIALRSQLYGVGSADPTAALAGLAVVAAAAALTGWAAGRKATRVDPVTALRAD